MTEARVNDMAEAHVSQVWEDGSIEKRRLMIGLTEAEWDDPDSRPVAWKIELLDEIEQTLGLTAVPFNWPIGEGAGFQGVYDLRGQQILFFQPMAHPRGIILASLVERAFVIGDVQILPAGFGVAQKREFFHYRSPPTSTSLW